MKTQDRGKAGGSRLNYVDLRYLALLLRIFTLNSNYSAGEIQNEEK